MELFGTRSRTCEYELDAAYADADRKRLQLAAHALAGSAAIVGATFLHDRVAELETRRDLPWDDVAKILVDVHDACERTRAALHEEVHGRNMAQ